jgi:acetyl-CoA synthetase
MEGVMITSKTTATQLVEDLLATFSDPHACVAELLCDRHPADAVFLLFCG